MKRINFRWLIVLAIFLLSACTTSPEQTVVSITDTPTAGLLMPYSTPTPSATPLPPDPATATPFPTPTTTPRTHVVKSGEDMLSIAFRYGITLDELKNANPDVDPNLMSVDTVLVIPASSQSQVDADVLPTPTAVSASLKNPGCYSSAEGGLWCFTMVENPNDYPLESISAVVRLADTAGVQMDERTALTPLNLLPAHAMLPLMVYFPAPVPADFQVNVSFQSALPVSASENRYLPAQVENLQIEQSTDRLSATVSGEISLAEGTTDARLIWVAAVAYESSGAVNGVRRWETNQTLTVGSMLPFDMVVYSMGSPIAKVDVFVECRP